jgi:hypothetical protein
MQRTADFHDPSADPRLSQATDSVDDAAALAAAVDVLDAHTSAGDAPLRRVLGPRELASPRLPGWPEDVHLRKRKRQNAQGLEHPAPRRHGVRGRLRPPLIGGAAGIGRTQTEARERRIDQQHVFAGVALFLAAITARWLRRILGAREAPLGPLVAKRGEAGAGTGTVDGSNIGDDSAVGATMGAASASATPRRWANAVNDRVGASPSVRNVARRITKRTCLH